MADPPPGLRAGLAGRYTIERELGRGGMATVYLARDLRHDRPVALKVLHPDLAATLGVERFQREIRLAARLQHPHILSIHDSGDVPGAPGAAPTLWFAMPFVEGESLRDRLTRERQLPLEDAIQIAREAADALDYAHQHGVIHRDIKPENILLSTGHALVADFGIARALSERADHGLTQTGTTVGTPAYMSPEQAAGERALDPRTDIYSLGCVLWEMIAGEPPFSGATAQIVLARRFAESPRPLRQVRETVPEGIERAVAKALARSPADRFATAAEFARALREGAATAAAGEPGRPTAAEPATVVVRPGGPSRRIPVRVPVAAALLLGFLLGLGVLVGWLRSHGEAAADAGGAKRLAVLPFENLGRSEDDYFADGITDEIRGKLAGLPELLVTASNSSSQYKKTSKTPQEIGRELGVQYLLVGKVRWEKGAGGQSRVRVSPELVQVATGTTRWQQPFDAALTDVFQVQADVASRVAQAMDVALGAGEKEALAGKPTASLPAYDIYLRGNEAAAGFDQVAPAELRRAIGYYERAVALDSTFALAWAQLSRAHSNIYFISTPTRVDEAEARAAAERALSLAPDLAEGHLALGDYYSFVRKDGPAALEEYAKGRRLAPNNAELLKGIGLVARSQGRWDESQASLTQALALDPRSIGTARRLTYNLLRLRHYPEAIAAADQALALDPRAPDLHETKAMVYLAQGDLAGARRVLQEAQRTVEPTALVQWTATYFDLFWVLDDAQQRLLLRLLPGSFDDDRQSWGLALAETWAFRGDTARARVYADSARLAGEANLREAPDDGQLHALLGVTLAYLGRKPEAIREGRRAVELLPISRDAYVGPYIQQQLARIYILVGEPAEAVDALEPLLKMPYLLSPGWLRVDPTFDPLRGDPRFRRLTEGGAAASARS